MNYETPHDDLEWTDHPDAHPDLTHCPSCGEPVDDVDGDPGRCDQCDRDLRLPRYAVKDQLCVCCKVPEADADEDVTYIRLETGERACSNCLADLRSFKYEVEVQTFMADWVTDEHRAAINQALFQVADSFEKDYSFTANANARYGRMEPIPEEEKAITLEAVIGGDVSPEDLPDEVREQIPTDAGADADDAE
ncbi:hypothetical protein [Natronosalvus rutilus]|uniref:Uncharacterized protein n=1 Tax=Natronosalvus rutilus TaxID=2953753 RepID=A0A9E7NFL2_9EURY|nr:hypothetical protein [Natronosalvus rutilus]UTF55999.1 hypothetical protein NGM29_20645 [Natronosalvus rutilus]